MVERDYKKTERGVPHMLAARRHCLVIQTFIVISEKCGCWDGTKTDILCIRYSIFHILILKSVLIFFTFATISFDDTGLIIVLLYSVICQLPFWSLPKLVDIPCATSMILAPFGLQNLSASDSRTFPFPRSWRNIKYFR